MGIESGPKEKYRNILNIYTYIYLNLFFENTSSGDIYFFLSTEAYSIVVDATIEHWTSIM